MATKWVISTLTVVFCTFISVIPFSHSQSNSPQNIQTVYPLWPIYEPPTPNSPPPNEPISPTRPPQPPPSPAPIPQPVKASSSTKKAVATAVGITAASALVIFGIVFFLLSRRMGTRRERDTRLRRPNPYAESPRVLPPRDHNKNFIGIRPHPYTDIPAAPREEFRRFNGNLKGLIVDEDGLDVVYWRKLHGEDMVKKDFVEDDFRGKKSEPRVQEIPLLRDKSSTSQDPVWAKSTGNKVSSIQDRRTGPQPPSSIPQPPNSAFISTIPKGPSHPQSSYSAATSAIPTGPSHTQPSYSATTSAIPNSPSLPPPPNSFATSAFPKGPSNPQPSYSTATSAIANSPSPPQPPNSSTTSAIPPQPSNSATTSTIPKGPSLPPPPNSATSAIPKVPSLPPPPNSASTSAIPKAPSPPPPPPPNSASTSTIPKAPSPLPPPPPPPKTGGFGSSSKAPPPPPPKGKGMPSKSQHGQPSSSSGKSVAGNEGGQVPLKPLHWDKVNPNVDHSMVWHKIDGGSFNFDGDLMEALFGNVAINRKSPQGNNKPSTSNGGKNSPPSQINILDVRKSQNIAIVLRSLAISRKEIIEALEEGQGLNVDTLEKFMKMAPTKDEASDILEFDGDPTRLATAESFLFHVLKAVPTAFTRFRALLNRSNHEADIVHLNESMQTLEKGCKELKTQGLFLKLLEAVLKAGNRMNAGTSRGNAQAFNLTALRKLSDVKSADGKTTLLNFVVEEVVRSEGKRCVNNKNRSLSRGSSRISRTSDNNSSPVDERDKEYKMLGLPIVGGISSEFSNVKKAAMIDYQEFTNKCSSLATRVAEIRQLVAQCAATEDGFVGDMRKFLTAAEEELKVMKEKQKSVIDLVKKTTEYYQATGGSRESGTDQLKIFAIVKDFLGLVDQACVEIARNLQKRKTATVVGVGSSPSPSKSPATTIAMRFPILPANFMSERSKSSSDDSDDEFAD